MASLLRVFALCLSALVGLTCGGSEDSLEEIRELHRNRRFAKSVEPLRELLDRDPSQAEPNLLLGVALLRTGQAGLAIWPLQKAAESAEYAVEARLLLAQAMLDSRSAHDAVIAADQVLALEPDHVAALAIRVDAYQATGRPVQALADIERVLELDPENLSVLVSQVTALISTDRIEEAEEALEAARERFETSEREIAPSWLARLCVARGLFAFEKGEVEAAEAQYSECLEEFPSDQLAVSGAVAFYDRTGRRERATEIIQRTFEESGQGFWRVALARRLGAMGQSEEEERLLREEAEERPSPMIWFAIADRYAQREQFDAALEAFEEALAASRAAPPMLRFAYADTLVQAQQYEKARDVVRELEQAELRELIHGRILLAEGDPSGALEAFEAGIRLWPNNAAGRFLAGQAAERVGYLERASSHYRESLRADPAQSEAGMALARLYEARGDAFGALDALGRHMRTHPRDPEGLLLTIRVAHSAERHELAAEGLERLARLPGQAPVAVAEEARLVAERRGPKGAIAVIESSQLDLTDPANAPALRELLTQLAAQGERDPAEQQIVAALEAHPELAVFHELRGRTLQAAGAPAAAGDSFQRALELDPDDARALAGLAELAAAAGERDAAIALFEQAADADPDDPAPAFGAAKLLLEAGRPQAARERLEQLLYAHPREGEAAIALARILEEQGELERAASYARRAAWLRTPESEETLERIRGKSPAPSAPPAG